MNHMIRVVVRRGSHCHHTPQTLRPQTDPVTRHSVVNNTPISAEASANRSQRDLPRTRYITLPTATTPNAANASQALGTCTNSRR